jgi:hypothetical protein
MQAILFFLLALFPSRDSRIVYDTPTPVYSGVSPEIGPGPCDDAAHIQLQALVVSQALKLRDGDLGSWNRLQTRKTVYLARGCNTLILRGLQAE